MSNQFSRFTTKDVHLAELVASFFDLQRFPVRERTLRRGARSVYRIEVAVESEDLKEISQAIRSNLYWARCWQRTAFGRRHGCGGYNLPEFTSDWHAQFSAWIAARWFDSDHPLADQYDEFCGPNAGASELEPLFVRACEGGSFDLNDARTLSYWLEYLSEYPARRWVWRRFQKTYEECSLLMSE